MGKTSIAKELGRHLQNDGWEFLFVDVEDAASPQDVIRDIAKAAHAVAGRSSRLTAALGRWFKDNIEELSAFEFGLKVRSGGTDYAWRRQGEALIQACADHESGVLLVLDELPIFLSRLWAEDERLAQLFLRWLRSLRQQHAGSSLALMVSGSIGMAPLVARMGMPDSINDLYNFPLGPWSRSHSVECLRCLGQHNAVKVSDAALHNGHLENTPDGHRLPFRLLADWLRTRFGNHHVPLQQRSRMRR